MRKFQLFDSLPEVPKVITPEEFEALPKNERKILVAQDVIAQLKSKQLIAFTGDYLDITKQKCSPDDSARDAIINEEIKCTVCARGALFISAVKFKNKLKVGDLFGEFTYTQPNYSSGRNTKFLKTLFTENEQKQIETVFEGVEYVNNDKLSEKLLNYRHGLIQKRKREKSKLSIDNYVLINICQNIIDNNGKFVV